jgi:hypothetical protein
MNHMLERVLRALDGLESGDYATESIKFGRGVAFACKVIRAAVMADSPIKHPLGGCNPNGHSCKHY